jgi:undecaprenyl-diphosphatase
MYFVAQLDTSLFFAIHSLAGRGIVGDFIIVFFGEYFIYLVFIIFICVAYLAYKKQKNIAILKPYLGAVIAAGVAYGIANAIRFFYHHLRPFITFSIPHLLTDTAYSFPSVHTIVLFALATATYFFNKKLSYFIFAAGFVVGFARIAGGVHYPSDIVGGIVLGIATSYILYWLYIFFCRNNKRAIVKR